MEKRTSEHQPTVRPPEVSAAILSLESIVESLNEVETGVELFIDACVFEHDFKALREQLLSVQQSLETCRRPVDPYQLRRVLVNSLHAQS